MVCCHHANLYRCGTGAACAHNTHQHEQADLAHADHLIGTSPTISNIAAIQLPHDTTSRPRRPGRSASLHFMDYAPLYEGIVCWQMGLPLDLQVTRCFFRPSTQPATAYRQTYDQEFCHRDTGRRWPGDEGIPSALPVNRTMGAHGKRAWRGVHGKRGMASSPLSLGTPPQDW